MAIFPTTAEKRHDSDEAFRGKQPIVFRSAKGFLSRSERQWAPRASPRVYPNCNFLLNHAGKTGRDIFQVTLIDVAKRNVSFSFTSANSGSDEWYTDLIRIPDVVAGSIAGFDFNYPSCHTAKPAALSIIGAYPYNKLSLPPPPRLPSSASIEALRLPRSSGHWSRRRS